MTKYIVVICASLFTNFSIAGAPSIPKQYQGAWAENVASKENCDSGPESTALLISKDQISVGEIGCKVVSVTNEGAGIKVVSKCSIEGEYFDDTVSLNLLGNKLKANNRNWQKQTLLLSKCK